MAEVRRSMSARKERLRSSRTVARLVNGIKVMGKEVLSQGSWSSMPPLEQRSGLVCYSAEADPPLLLLGHWNSPFRGHSPAFSWHARVSINRESPGQTACLAPCRIGPSRARDRGILES
jgi:hypothetical protein